MIVVMILLNSILFYMLGVIHGELKEDEREETEM